MSEYRDDPRWQEAHRRYLDDHAGESPDAAQLRRVQAAYDMADIERDWSDAA